MRRRTDDKIHRLMTGRLGASRRDAAWFAATADEFTAPADTQLVPGRFAYIVVPGSGDVVVAHHTAVEAHAGDTVFAVAAHHLDEVYRRIPIVAAAGRPTIEPITNVGRSAELVAPVAVAA